MTTHQHTYKFTKAQAAQVTRNMVVTYWEARPNVDQDAEQLACRLIGALEIFILPRDVENALIWLDERASLDRGTHPRHISNRAGTLDNTAALAEYIDQEFAHAIDMIVTKFHTRYELAA